MTTRRTSIAVPLALLLLFSDGALTLWNWTLAPGRAAVWIAVLFLLAVMAAVLGFARRHEGERVGTNPTATTGVVFGAATLAFSLAGTIAAKHGLQNLAWRGTMIVVGLFFVVTANEIPKTLIPLQAMHGDPAKVQAVRRFTGWTWVLAGLALSASWLLLSIAAAQTLTFVLLPSAILAVGVQWVRLRRVDQEAR